MTWLLLQISELGVGLSTPGRAAMLIARHPRLLAWSLLPMAVLTGLWSLGIYEAFQALAARDQTTWAWVTAAVLAVFALVSFSFLGALIATPFSDLLALATERTLVPPPPPAPEISFFSRAQVRIVAIDLVKTLAAWGIAAFAWVVGLIPLLTLFSMAVTAFTLAFAFVSYPQTRRGWAIAPSLRQLLSRPGLVLGFGISVMLLSLVPFASGFFLPLHVVGGTWIFGRLLERRAEHRGP